MTQQAFRIILGTLIALACAQFALAKAQRTGPIKQTKTHWSHAEGKGQVFSDHSTLTNRPDTIPNFH